MLSSYFQGDVDTHKGDPSGRHLRLSLYSQFTGTNVFVLLLEYLSKIVYCVGVLSTTTMGATKNESISSNLKCTPIFRFRDISLSTKVTTLELYRPTQ